MGAILKNKTYLIYSVAATTWMLGIPLAAVLFPYARGVQLRPAYVALGIVAASSALAGACGAGAWRLVGASTSVPFAELMLWRWARRTWALQTLERRSDLLGTSQVLPLRRERRQLKVLARLNSALETKDPYTHGHSSRVERLTRRTAAELDLSDEDIAALGRAAALHDIGKIEVPDRILLKSGPLTAEEKAIVESHAVIGAHMLALTMNPRVTEAVLHHHERWDGLGYPHGLAGTRIPLFARIIAVADTYDAMTSTRPYRSALKHDAVLDAIKVEAGRQFDTEVVKAFERAVEDRAFIPALAPIALGLTRLRREIVKWLRQPTQAAGMSAASGVAAATMAATVLLSAIPVHDVGLRAPAPPAVGEMGAEVATGEAGTESVPAKDRRISSRARADSPTDASNSGSVVTAGDPVTPAEPGVVASGTGDGPSQPGEDQTDEADPQPGSPAPDTDSSDSPKGDPQPDKGNDCQVNPGKGKGKGHAIHCGG